MSLDAEHLNYPLRRHGMDHDFYDWSMLENRPRIFWPDGKKLAVWVNVNVQFFPLNEQKNPVPVPGGMKMPYPDLRHYSLRDYGNRVGIFRLFKALDSAGVKPTVAINGAMVERAPYLMDFIAGRGDEVIAHGWKMDDLHHGGLSESAENALISETLSVLRNRFEQPVTGWLSPGRLQSASTPSLLAKNGISYMCDWVNDDMPYAFRTNAGGITAMPLSSELDDFFIMGSNLHSEDSYETQLKDACDLLLNEAEEQGGRLLAINLHPWMTGQPHRIGCLEKALQYIADKQGVWFATASEIQHTWQSQQP